MILSGRELDGPGFTAAQCEALFAAVLINDRVDAETRLPDAITLDHGAARLLDCFRLCRQLWKTGVDRRELIGLTRRLARDHDLGAADRLRFKYARAEFKQLRFAYALYDATHRYPWLLDYVTRTMGRLQDAYKHGQVKTVVRTARLLRFLLSPLPWFILRLRIGRLQPVSGAGFRAYVARQVGLLQAVLAHDQVTGAQFHATRKIVSRQVSFYDTLRTLEPSPEAYLMSRSLSAINGLMGAMHDELVERRKAGTQDYHRQSFSLPAEIRQRLAALAERYASSLSQDAGPIC